MTVPPSDFFNLLFPAAIVLMFSDMLSDFPKSDSFLLPSEWLCYVSKYPDSSAADTEVQRHIVLPTPPKRTMRSSYLHNIHLIELRKLFSNIHQRIAPPVPAASWSKFQSEPYRSDRIAAICVQPEAIAKHPAAGLWAMSYRRLPSY